MNKSRTLLAIIASPAENELVARHWPYFKITGWEILGCGTVDKQCVWPEDVTRLDTGKIGKRMTRAGSAIWGLCEQEVSIWQWFMDHPEFDSVAVVEADGLFVRKPPANHPGGPYLVSLVPNFAPTGLFNTSTFFQTPRWSDRETTQRLLRHGREMLVNGDTQWDMSDRFPAWICYKNHIEFMPFPAYTPFSFPAWAGMSSEDHAISRAKIAVQCGCVYLHSIKTKSALRAVEETMVACGLDVFEEVT